MKPKQTESISKLFKMSRKTCNLMQDKTSQDMSTGIQAANAMFNSCMVS